MSMIRLRGIAWDHSRGFTPMVATAQRYEELNPGVTITWEKRSLQAFADSPIEQLAETFDLLVIDHPFMGFVGRHEVLLELSSRVPPAELAGHAAHSVGPSHGSYQWEGRRWALAIDAATPVSGWREDLLLKHRADIPQTWKEVLELARHGLVAVAGLPVDCLMNFFMFCHACGEEPCVATDRVVTRGVGLTALESQREFMRMLPPETWSSNPIRMWDRLAHSTAGPAYCPFAYAYSNYARNGYAPHRLRFGRPPAFNGRPLRPTLGGTGLAISARCAHSEAALDYVRQVAGPGWQRSIYFESGGQPAHRAVWLDPEANRLAHGFFTDTLQAHDYSWVRPRYCGYLDFQDQGGTLVRNFLIGQRDARETLEALDAAYRASLGHASVAT